MRQHFLGGGGLYQPLLEAATRKALADWAQLPSSDVSFSEGLIYSGPACPHILPLEVDPDGVCAGGPREADGHSALFFIETSWPFGEEVIALTSVSYEVGGRTVDADISFNGVDYTWSVSDSSVRTDFQSIVLHELGHLLGLGHSQEPGAVMALDYVDGDLVRDLSDDDGLGLAQVYPCPSPPCIGGVGWEGSSSCAGGGSDGGGSISWSLRAAALPLSLFLGLGLARRRREGRYGVAILGLGLGLAIASPVDSSTARSLDIVDLSERADLVIHARVVDRDSWRDGIAWTRISFDVLDSWKGEVGPALELVVPGGWTGDFGTLVFGMPSFEPGEEVALFLAGEDGAWRPLGLSQGKFAVAADGSLSRDLSGLQLARVGGRLPREVSAPQTLQALRQRVREAAAAR